MKWWRLSWSGGGYHEVVEVIMEWWRLSWSVGGYHEVVEVTS